MPQLTDASKKAQELSPAIGRFCAIDVSCDSADQLESRVNAALAKIKAPITRYDVKLIPTVRVGVLMALLFVYME